MKKMVLVKALAEGLGFYYDKNGKAAVGEFGGYYMRIKVPCII